MQTMRQICVYCGASSGVEPAYAEAARGLAAVMVERQIGLVYGGGRLGLMGILADEVLRLGGEVTGVIPLALQEKEVAHLALTRLHVVADMHQRKAMMAQLADGFIAMPGGLGTLEELFEMLTWLQLDLHRKPVGLLNVAQFYSGLLSFLQHCQTQGFVRTQHAQLLQVDVSAAALIDKLAGWQYLE